VSNWFVKNVQQGTFLAYQLPAKDGRRVIGSRDFFSWSFSEQGDNVYKSASRFKVELSLIPILGSVLWALRTVSILQTTETPQMVLLSSCGLAGVVRIRSGRLRRSRLDSK